MKSISTVFVAALLSGQCGLIAQTAATPNDLFGPVKITLADGVNSPDLDFSPIYFNNGIIFTSDRLGENAKKAKDGHTKGYTDLFFSEKKGAFSFKAPTRLRTLNTEYHDGIATFSAEDNKLYFTRNNKSGTILNTNKAKRLKIYVSTFVDNEWSEAQEVSFNVEKYSTCHPAISADGKTMYFASNRPGGYGGMDIYVTYWENGTWTEPINMGSDVNTESNEVFPFMDVDGALYFSSEGHLNQGGLDMFLAQEVVDPHNPGDNNWEITNLGEPFNSEFDDFGYVGNAAGNEGFFTSGRGGGFGGDDIYGWEVVEEEEVMAVKDVTKKDITPKSIKVVDAHTGKVIVGATIAISPAKHPAGIQKLKTQQEGSVEFDWTEDNEYFVATEKEGYTAQNKIYTSDQWNNDVLTIEVVPKADISATARINESPTAVRATLAPDSNVEAYQEDISSAMKEERTLASEKLSKGQLVELQHIYYEFDKYYIKESAKEELNTVVTLMRQYPEMEIELNSHTDSRGTDAYNQWLSQQRANAAVKYIVSQGIAASRIKAKGYGESMPVNECTNRMKCTPDKHQMNRRTEFIIKNLGDKNILKSNTSSQKSMTLQSDTQLPVIQSVYHASAQTELTHSDKEVLRKLATMMKRNEGMTIKVASFTDAIGSPMYNMSLSEQRAQKITNYITSQGVKRNRVAFEGFGEMAIRNGCTDEATCDLLLHNQNRRTDILVTNPGGADITAFKK